MYGKNLSGHTSLVLRPIKALLLLLFPEFEGLHGNIKLVIIGCTQRKLFKGNDRQGECEQTIGLCQICWHNTYNKYNRLANYYWVNTFVKWIGWS